jgi:regulator of protease activity HflC (stomatin/prohibitin superfamily)
MEVALVFAFVVLVVVFKSLKVVEQQSAYVIERLGKYHSVLSPGISVIIPFIDRIAYKHSLKEIPLDVPAQVCVTKDNSQLRVDGVIFFQVTDPVRASYGSQDYITSITQLAQTTLRSVIGKLELDRTFEERDIINTSIVSAIDEAAANWGVKVLRYEIKDLTPPDAILKAMQAQITAEREKRALIAQSEGQRQQQINLAEGERQSLIVESEGNRMSAINKAEGEAQAITLVADATADALAKIAKATQLPGGIESVNLKIAERFVDAFAQMAKQNNTLIIPSNVSDIAGLVASSLSVVKAAGGGQAGR